MRWWWCRRIDEVEELVDKPGTTNGALFDVSQWIFLPFLMRCGFWPLVQWRLHPNSSHNFPSERTAGVFSRSITVAKHSNSRTYTVASSFACTSSLAVTTVVGLSEILTVSNSAELRSFLLTICMLAPESTTNTLSSGFIVDAAGKIHSSEGEWNVALSSFFWANRYSWQVPTRLRGHVALVLQPLLEICPQIS